MSREKDNERLLSSLVAQKLKPLLMRSLAGKFSTKKEWLHVNAVQADKDLSEGKQEHYKHYWTEGRVEPFAHVERGLSL